MFDFEQTIVNIAQVIRERNIFKRQADYFKRENQKLKASLTERDNRIDDLLLDQNNLKSDIVALKKENEDLEASNDNNYENWVFELEKREEIEREKNKCIARIKKLESKLDFANGDYIVEENK